MERKVGSALISWRMNPSLSWLECDCCMQEFGLTNSKSHFFFSFLLFLFGYRFLHLFKAIFFSFFCERPKKSTTRITTTTINVYPTKTSSWGDLSLASSPPMALSSRAGKQMSNSMEFMTNKACLGS